MARDKKAKNMERFEARLKEDGWHLIVSACYQIDELEKKLAKEVRLREMADAKIRSLEKKG